MEWNLEMEPRPYQEDALERAQQHEHSVCCLPTGTGKTFVGVLWLKSLFDKGLITHAVVLEPTRLLVNQTADCFKERGGVEAVPIDGTISPEVRRSVWSSSLVVCTAQTAYNDLPHLRAQAAVVDECHHTVGQHAFARLIAERQFEHTLGLSATIPEKRRKEVESALGRIHRWKWSDPRIQPFVPNWIGEVFDSELDDQENSVLAAIRRLKGGPGSGPGLLERYLTRDGSAALLETMAKQNKVSAAFRDSLPPIRDQLHKLAQLDEVFDSHDFEKAIVFVDRVSIAKRIAKKYPQLKPVVFVGKRSGDQGQALRDSRRPDVRIVASTSAGEEGIDLPSADLLVIWGNAASDVRFIQRLGRIMRKAGDGLKFATFLVTPESNDFDSFADGLSNAAEAGALEVEKTFGWDPDILWPKTTWWHISESLRQKPTPLPVLEEHLNVRGNLASKIVGHAAKRGRVFYIYNVAQIATDIVRYYLDFDTYRSELAPIHDQMRLLNREFQGRPEPVRLAREIANLVSTSDDSLRSAFRQVVLDRVSSFSVAAPVERDEQQRIQRIYMLSEDAPQTGALLPHQVSRVRPLDSRVRPFVTPIVPSHRGGKKKGVSPHRSIWGKVVGRRGAGQDLSNPAAFWDTQISAKWRDDFLGYSIVSGSTKLDFYFRPVSRDVFAATWHNMNRLMMYREMFRIAVQVCSVCDGIGAARHEDISTGQLLCPSCWQAMSARGQMPGALAEFASLPAEYHHRAAYGGVLSQEVQPMNYYNFGPASAEDSIVYGACGPGNEVEEWISFMQRHGIERVCCLQMERPELVTIYEKEFGTDNVRGAPIQDFHICSLSTLKKTILPFLHDSYVRNKRVVVHCAGGNGRTGHVLAAWLVFHADLVPAQAIITVEQMGRNPREAIRMSNATEAELTDLLFACKDA